MSVSPFEHLFDISPFPAVVSRLRDHSVVAINRRTSEMFGISHAEALGLITSDYYAEIEHRERLRAPLEKDGRADNVVLHLRRPNGDTFWARASARLITWENEPAVLTVFEDISDQLSAQRTLEASEQRLAAQSRALTSLTARHADPTDTFAHRVRAILEVAAETLQTERVSMWRFDDGRSNIECIGLFRRSEAHYETGARLARANAPAYFDAIEQERVIAAHDARTDPRTRDFMASYLEPNAIGAMLDVPLRRADASVGVLCVEHVGGPRTWTVDEQNFAVSTANLIAVAIADERRREALSQVAESDARAHADPRHRARRLRRHECRRQHRRVERAGGTDLRLDARGSDRPEPRRDHHSAGVIAKRMTQGMRRFLATGEAPVVNQPARAARAASPRPRVPDRDHDHAADAA